MPIKTISNLTESDAWILFNSLPNVGPVSFKKLLKHFNNKPLTILNATKQQLKAVDGVGEQIAESIVNWPRYFDLGAEKATMQSYGASFYGLAHEGYPSALREVYDPPIGLYWMGQCPPQEKCIAIVGSRRCTLYGRGVAKELAEDLVKAGYCIVSGMARGIDSAAHEGALEAGGKTLAVLGCGPDIIYPPENKGLYEKIQTSGAIVSEFHFGKKADKMTFPRRNRIVSGMCVATIVVETNSNGGSMITARMACEQGRQVFAVPGRVDQASSRGCHDLIRDGAVLIRHAGDVIEELEQWQQGELNLATADNFKPRELPQDLAPNERAVVVHLRDAGARSCEHLINELNLEFQDISSALIMLEVKGLIAKSLDGSYESKV